MTNRSPEQGRGRRGTLGRPAVPFDRLGQALIEADLVDQHHRRRASRSSRSSNTLRVQRAPGGTGWP